MKEWLWSVYSRFPLQWKTKDDAPAWKMWSFWLFVAGVVASYVVIICAVARAVSSGTASHQSFWALAQAPGAVALLTTAFFGIGAFVSLCAHAVLAFEAEVRWLGLLAAALTSVYIVELLLAATGLQAFTMMLVAALNLAVFVMIFGFIAVCGRTSPKWLVMQVFAYFAYVIAIDASDQNPAFEQGGGDLAVLFGPPWQQAVFYIFYVFSGILRLCALVECKYKRSTTVAYGIFYWVIILLHMAAFFGALAIKRIVSSGSPTAVDDAQFFAQMSILVQCSLTPLLMVHYESLYQAKTRLLEQEVHEASKNLAVVSSAAEARREFIRYVFHEVRVPFNTVMLGLDELRRLALDLRHAEMLQDITLMQTAADGMQQILNDTLTVEKMESGTYSLELKPTNVAQMANAVVNSMQGLAKDKRIELSAEISPEVPEWTLADPNRLSQVMANFLSNALKFVDQSGNGRVKLRVAPIPAPSPARGPEPSPTAAMDARSRAEKSNERPSPATTARAGATARAQTWLSWLQRHLGRVRPWPPEPSQAPIACTPFGRPDVRIPLDETTSATSVAPTVSVQPGPGDTNVECKLTESPCSASDTSFLPPLVQWVSFRVEDNGVGISAGDVATLFRPFSQIKPGERQKGKGSGLGLHICREIVRRHGGHVGVESVLGSGSVFFAELPLQVCHKPPADVSMPAMSSAASTSSSGVGFNFSPDSPRAANESVAIGISPLPSPLPVLRMLLVDDVQSNRLFLRRGLQRQLPATHFDEAEDGSQAVEMVRQDLERYQVICMDKEMPVLDGYRAAGDIRRLGYTGCIIGVTANALSEDVHRFMEHGVNAVVTKPVNMSRLMDIIMGKHGEESPTSTQRLIV